MTVHGLEQSLKVLPLQGQETVDGFPLVRFVLGHDHPLDDGQAIGLKKHMLGSAQANSLGSVLAGPFCVTGVICIGSRPEVCEFRLPTPKSSVDRGLLKSGTTVGNWSKNTSPEAPSSEIQSPSRIRQITDLHFSSFQVDLQFDHAHHGGCAKLTCHQGSVTVLPPRLVRMPLEASIPCTSSGLVSGRTMMTSLPSRVAQRSAVSASKATTTHGCSWGDIKTCGNELARCAGSRVELRVQKDVHLGGLQPLKPPLPC